MWVLRRIPANSTRQEDLSPWKGCLHIDREGRAWFATGLAQPTQFSSEQDAEECREIIKIQFPESEIQVAMYEEIFQKPLPIPTTRSITTVKNTINIPDWNWDNGEQIPL